MRYLNLWPVQKTVQRDLWRDFDDMFRSLAETNSLREFDAHSPQLDVEESADEYSLKFDLPGLDRKDIKIEVKENTLFVTGERTRERKTDGEFTRYERFHGRFERALTLPQGVESDKIDAKYKDGVLELHIPKGKRADIKQIEIKN
jgi:HSP20 family protein